MRRDLVKLDYDLEKDFVPVILIAAPPQVVTVNPSKVQAKTLAEFIAFAKANPGKVDYAPPVAAPRIISRENCSKSSLVRS